jgi:citrate synthase
MDTQDGLEGVVAASTSLSHVDGEQGRLILRGYDLDELAGAYSFEWAAALFWEGLAPEPVSEELVRRHLGEGRAIAWKRASSLVETTKAMTPVEGLRLLLSSLADAEPFPHYLLTTSAMAVFTAAIPRARAGQTPIEPDPERPHVEDFLRMLMGGAPSREHVEALETYLVTVIDHGLNASTFAARVIASTQAGTISAVVGALCALKGPLHGGAPGPVLDTLDEIGTPDRAEPYLREKVLAGDRLMGFGHRVYRVRDPRADVLKKAVIQLRDGTNRIRFAAHVEQTALRVLAELKPGRRLDTNVEFYTALLLDAIGLPRDSFTPVFAMGRVVGWTAHILEQEKTGRLIRPQSRYIGPMPEARQVAVG